jgi:hypothetical protein
MKRSHPFSDVAFAGPVTGFARRENKLMMIAIGGCRFSSRADL